MARRQPSKRKPPTKRHYARTARLNTLLQQIVGDYFERSEDGEFGFLTVTGVEVDNDLNVAEVFVSSFEIDPGTNPEAAEELLDQLDAQHRKPIKKAIAQEAQLRKTPNVIFKFDHGVQAGSRVEEILRELEAKSEESPEDTDGPQI